MKKFLVIGNPIDHSLSPKLHNYWIKQNKINAIYEKQKMQDKDLESLIIQVKEKNINGINVTVPFKKSIIPFLDKLSDEAQKTQSVNTIYLDNNKVIGHNTDIGGFEMSIQRSNIDLSNKNKLMRSEAGDNFNVLEMFEVEASDEALFGNLDWIKNNEKDVDIFVTALLSVWQDLHEDPTIIRRETNPDGPIGQLPPEILAELDGFYTDAVAGGLYDPNGGGRKAANADMEWYSAAGQLKGSASDLNIEDFWYLAPLDKASK